MYKIVDRKLTRRTEVIQIGKNEDIIRLFYEEHKRPTYIAEELNVSKPYITKIIQKDERYIKENEYRSNISKENHKASKRNYINKRRQTEKQEYQAMIIQINKDNEYLSTKTQISDLDFAKWNRGMFQYDKNSSDLVLRRRFKYAFDVPKRISNVIHASCIRNKRIYV